MELTSNLELQPLEEGRLTFRGGILAYRIYGEGEPLLILPQRGLSPSRLCAFLPHLLPRYRVILPDLWGDDGSLPDTALWDYGVFADLMVFLLARLGCDRVVLAGIGDGAVAALELACSYPGIPSRLALCDPRLSPAGLSFRQKLHFSWRLFLSLWHRERLLEAVQMDLALREPHIPRRDVTLLAMPTLCAFRPTGPVARRHRRLLTSLFSDGAREVADVEAFLRLL